METKVSKGLFVITASNVDARDHVEKSIKNPITSIRCEDYFDSDFLERVKAQSSDGQYYAWGAVPGPNNIRNWNDLEVGDYVLVYQNRRYTFASRVIAKQKNKRFAKDLWGTDPEGKTWELMYFLDRPESIDISVGDVADILQSQYMGFTQIDENRINRIQSNFGSIEKFIEKRFKAAMATTYLLLRSNEESPWKDEEGQSYHYGDTVPNYTKIVPGSQFLLDRRSPEGKRIIGSGRIASISEEPGSGKSTRNFRAQFDGYETFESPRLITPEDEDALSALPGYNPQHSIRVLSKELFERLQQIPKDGKKVMNPELHKVLEMLQEKGFFFPDTLVKNYLISLRTKGFVIMTGMSGGGKTALTWLVAEALDEPHLVVAVKPNWTDSRDLLGFYNPISQTYVRTEALNFIMNALKEYETHHESAKRFHLCLDEMNLSRVEYYFADLLSAMELPDRKITLHDIESLDIPRSIMIPPNLVVVGTVNIDETVQPFSDKVKDRANTITVPIDLPQYAQLLGSWNPPKSNIIKQKAFACAKTEQGKQAVDILLQLHRTLVPQQVHFGYRTMDEVLKYLAENASLDLLSFTEALDLQIDQKVLPKIRGRGTAFEELLACKNGQCESCLKCQCIEARLERSAERVDRLAQVLRDTGYTSYDATN